MVFGLTLWSVTVGLTGWAFATGWTLFGSPPVWAVPTVMVTAVLTTVAVARWPVLSVVAAAFVAVLFSQPAWCIDGVWLVQTDWYALQTAEVERLVQELWTAVGESGLPPIPAEVVHNEVLYRDGRAARWVVDNGAHPWMRFGWALADTLSRNWE